MRIYGSSYQVTFPHASHLVESKPVKTEASCGSQTDTFQPRPLPPRTFPRKTGVDVATHIPENELFKFEQEVQPLLDVLTKLAADV